VGDPSSTSSFLTFVVFFFLIIFPLYSNSTDGGPTSSSPPIAEHQFNTDVRYCKKSNQAGLARTIMTSIIDRWQLHKPFVYHWEGQWDISKIYQLPTRSTRDEVFLPKPNLAISFAFEAFTGSDTSLPFPEGWANACVRMAFSVDASWNPNGEHMISSLH
jgi:hypothetical protein